MKGNVKVCSVCQTGNMGLTKPGYGQNRLLEQHRFMNKPTELVCQGSGQEPELIYNPEDGTRQLTQQEFDVECMLSWVD